MSWLASLIRGILEALLPFIFKPKEAERAQEGEALDKDEAEWLRAQLDGTSVPHRVRDNSAKSGVGPFGDLGGRSSGDGSKDR